MSKPNLLRTVPAVAVCKLTRWALRLTGRGGTALPGRAARVVAPDILERVSDGMEIIVVTGTNGKTTTSRMIEHALTSSGRSVLANRSGANLLSGVTAEMTCNATMTGRPKTHYAVIECDEGALKQVVPLIHPRVIVVTNLFRDQLDRYGEVTHTVNAIRAGIEKVPEATLCLNADDSLVASLADGIANRVVWYGLDTPFGSQKEAAVSDAKYCIRCGEAYEYTYHTYAHLGGFRCPRCGYARPEADIAVTEVERIAADGSRVRMRVRGRDALTGEAKSAEASGAGAAAGSTGAGEDSAGITSDRVVGDRPKTQISDEPTTTYDEAKGDEHRIMCRAGAQHEFSDSLAGGSCAASDTGAEGCPVPAGELSVTIGLPAIYNVYNAVAAVCACTAFGLEPEQAADSLSDVRSSFGRMETFLVGENTVQMILVKNPAGCSQALSYVTSIEEDFRLILCLNDRTADGHDISWIWDADYELLAGNSHVQKILVSGDRAEDMQLRLKYAGVPEEQIVLEKDNKKLLEWMRNGTMPAFILPNYTSMLALRAVLAGATGGREFWEG